MTDGSIERSIGLPLANNVVILINGASCLHSIHTPRVKNINQIAEFRCLANITAIITGLL